jgi:hypothetical protein
MKIVSLITFLLFSFSVSATESCDKDTYVYGESSSWENIDGEVVLITKTYYVIKGISSHMTAYKNLVLYSTEKLKSLTIFNEVIPLTLVKTLKSSISIAYEVQTQTGIPTEFEFEVGVYRTDGYDLFEVANEKIGSGKLKIKIIGEDNYSCTREYEFRMSEGE